MGSLEPFLALVISLLLALLPSYFGINEIAKIIDRFVRKGTPSEETYSQKLNRLMGSLSDASGEVEIILSELELVTRERADRAEKLKTELDKLHIEEQELKQRIDRLQETPIEIAEYFAELSSSKEGQSRKRDYYLFIAGALVGLLSNIVVNLLIP